MHVLDSLSCHISFFYKEERLSTLSRVVKGIIDIDSVKNKDIFIHSNEFFELEGANTIVHNLEGKHPYVLSWLHRDLLKTQENSYDAFMYLEDDILFTNNNFLYWNEYFRHLKNNNFDLGYLRIETSNGREYVTDLLAGEHNKGRVSLKDNRYIIFDRKYWGFWLYDKDTFREFVNTPNFLNSSYSDIMREEAARGFINNRSALIPEINNEPHEGCKVYHLSNNYVDDVNSHHAKVLYKDSF
jgi:hypothetical protein